MNEMFEFHWSGFYFAILEIIAVWHCWDWAKTEAGERKDLRMDLFLGRFVLCQLAVWMFYPLGNYLWGLI